MQLTFAFDEVLAFGNRENSSLSNIKTALEMDSNEEKVFKMNQLAQEKQAKELASKRAKEIDQERVARAKSNLMGFGSNTDKRDSHGSGPVDYSRVTVRHMPFAPRFQSFPHDLNFLQIEKDEPASSYEASRPKAAPLKKGATLTLGSKKKDSMTMQALREEGELAPVASCVSHTSHRSPLLEHLKPPSFLQTCARWRQGRRCRFPTRCRDGRESGEALHAQLILPLHACSVYTRCQSQCIMVLVTSVTRATFTLRSSRSFASSSPAQPFAHRMSILIYVRRYSRDGGINSSELKGDMILTVNSETAAFVRVNLAPIKDKSLQLKNHPNINKQVRRANELCATEPTLFHPSRQ